LISTRKIRLSLSHSAPVIVAKYCVLSVNGVDVLILIPFSSYQLIPGSLTGKFATVAKSTTQNEGFAFEVVGAGSELIVTIASAKSPGILEQPVTESTTEE